MLFLKRLCVWVPDQVRDVRAEFREQGLGAFVYLLASKRHGTLYIGVTIDLARRLEQHRSGAVPGFTKTYGVTRLVYYEVFDDLRAAREREARMKSWRRDWKITLIEEHNPDWSDLTPTLI